MGDQKTISVETLQLATTETTAGTSAKTVSSDTALYLEVCINITDATDTLVLILETSIDGVNFATQVEITGITTTGVQTMAIGRDDFALGTVARVRWTVSGASPSFDFDIKLGRRE